MKQGEIWLVNLNPAKGKEQQGVRPVVILSGNAMNDTLGICIVCPLSTKIKHYAGCVVLKKDRTNGLDADSEIITFQIRAVSKDRMIHRLGHITVPQLDRIKTGLNEILKY